MHFHFPPLREYSIPTLALRLFLCAFLVIASTTSVLAQEGAASSESPSAPAAEGKAEHPTGEAEGLRALADLLGDPAAREALIDRLLEIAEAEKAGAGTSSPVPSDPVPDDAPLASKVAQATQNFAENVSSTVVTVAQSLADIGSVTALQSADRDAVFEAARLVAVVAAVTIGAYWLLYRIASRIFGALSRKAENAGFMRKTVLLVYSGGVDAVNVLGAWALGYAVALSIGETGEIDIRQSMFLNAFLLVEIIKVLFRLILTPGSNEMRVVGLSEETARYWYFWSSRVVGVLGYGMLLFVPIVSNNISPEAGRGFAILIALTSLAIAVTIVFQNKAAVRDAILAWSARMSDRQRGDPTVLVLRFVGFTWHLVMTALFTGAFISWLVNPEEAMVFYLEASGRTLVAIALGTLILTFMTRAITSGMRLPDDLKLRLPMLEQRLNAFVPGVLKVLRLITLVAVFVSILDSWTLLSVSTWLSEPAGQAFMGRIASALLVGVVAFSIHVAVTAWIDQRLDPTVGQVATARERTLISLFRNAFTVGLSILSIMLILSELGLDIGPLLAGAGVLGLAIGFGSQKLVQDIITGAFIQLENAMNEGDVVTVGGKTGTVEKLTVRSVGLRDLAGVYHLIPFSSVDNVSNFMRGFSYYVAEIGVAYRENVAEVKQLMAEAFERLKETEHGEFLLEEELEIHGLTVFGDSAITVRGRIKTQPGKQWAAGRAYNEIIKEIFDREGVEIPFPHMTLYWGEDKEGNAPPLRIDSKKAEG